MANKIVEDILKKGYQYPTVPMIGSEYKELYKLEGKRNEAVRAATEELAEVLGYESGDYFKRTVGESLYAILDNYESNVSILACVEYLKRHGIEIKDTE